MNAIDLLAMLIQGFIRRSEEGQRVIGQRYEEKYVRYLLPNGFFSPPCRVETRDPHALSPTNIPPTAIGCQFHEEWVITFQESADSLITLRSERPVKIGPLQFFRGTDGTLETLLEQKAILPHEAEAVLMRGNDRHSNIVVAYPYAGCNKDRIVFALAQNEYVIANRV